jgi:hypothetical protein
MNDHSSRVLIWWAALSIVAVVNICAWCVAAVGFKRDEATDSREVHAARRQQLLLSALFVAGCAFRSFLPRAEAQRICLYDSWISNAMLARSVATVAELCLVAQWALLLRRFAVKTGATFAVAVSRLALPLIAFAEICSWYTALTTNFIGSVFEESTWAVTSALLTLGFVTLWPQYRGGKRTLIRAAIAINLAYMAFMCTVDVPMYLARWTADEASHRQYLSLATGWRDAQQRRVVTYRWIDWRQEMPWMSLYFSAGVWISIALTRVPRLEQRAGS